MKQYSKAKTTMSQAYQWVIPDGMPEQMFIGGFPSTNADDIDRAVASTRTALHFARDVDAGQVFINQYFPGGIATPFGGTRQSGFGREKGLAALASYYQVKWITARLTDPGS